MNELQAEFIAMIEEILRSGHWPEGRPITPRERFLMERALIKIKGAVGV